MVIYDYMKIKRKNTRQTSSPQNICFCRPIWKYVNNNKLYFLPYTSWRCEPRYVRLESDINWWLFENKVLTVVFRPKREKVLERRQNYPKSYLIPNIFRVMKSRWVSWAGYPAHMREMRSVWKYSIRKPIEGVCM